MKTVLKNGSSIRTLVHCAGLETTKNLSCKKTFSYKKMRADRHINRAVELLKSKQFGVVYEHPQSHPKHITLITQTQAVRLARQNGDSIGYRITLEPIKKGIFNTPTHQTPLSQRLDNSHKDMRQPSRDAVLRSYTTHDINNVEAPFVSLGIYKRFKSDGGLLPKAEWVQAHKEYVAAMVVDICEPNGSPLALTADAVQKQDREMHRWLEPYHAYHPYACNPEHRLDFNKYMQNFVGKLVMILPELPLQSGRLCLYSLNGLKIDPLIGKSIRTECNSCYELATKDCMWKHVLAKTPDVSLWNRIHSRETHGQMSLKKRTRDDYEIDAYEDEDGSRWPMAVTPVYVLKQNVKHI